MNRYIISILIIIVFINCSTPYQPRGILGGFSTIDLGENLYRVEFKANQHTKVNTVFDYLERRCAEIATEKGYKYFIVYQDSSYTEELNFNERPELDERLDYQRSDKYLISEVHILDINPLETLYEQKTKINRTHNRHLLKNYSTEIVRVYKIKLENKVIENLKEYFYTADKILERYK